MLAPAQDLASPQGWEPPPSLPWGASHLISASPWDSARGAAGDLQEMFCCGRKGWNRAAHARSQHELTSAGSSLKGLK